MLQQVSRYNLKNPKPKTQNLISFGDTVHQLLFHRLQNQIAANADELSAGCSWHGVFELEPLICELEKVTGRTFSKPENPLPVSQAGESPGIAPFAKALKFSIAMVN